LSAGPLNVTRGAGTAHCGQGCGSWNSARGRTAVKLPQEEQAYSYVGMDLSREGYRVEY
jgi:hypothetical protein